jgi:hypothetical protein
MFQLQLNRVDYCQVGTTTNKCMRLMPSLMKELNKVGFHFYNQNSFQLQDVLKY